MRAVSSTVTRDLSLHVVSPPDGPRQVSVAMHYDTVDPYAVHAVFRVGPHQQITWVFARELLTRGLDQQVGEGDVRVWPTGEEEGEQRVRIALASPDGEALLEAPADEVVEFLTSTYALCARGREQQHLQIDRELSVLFGG